MKFYRKMCPFLKKADLDLSDDGFGRQNLSFRLLQVVVRTAAGISAFRPRLSERLKSMEGRGAGPVPAEHKRTRAGDKGTEKVPL